jgi:hypothetical protein
LEGFKEWLASEGVDLAEKFDRKAEFKNYKIWLSMTGPLILWL